MVYDYEYFKREFLKLSSIDLNCYKERQMKRRIDTLIRNKGLSGYDKYIAAIKSSPELFDEFLSYMTINVSEFYRNPEQWTYLDQEVMPYLINKFGTRLKIWSAACSFGEEPYSLVMLLSKHMSLAQISVFATDIDRNCLEQARQGLYPEKSIASVPEEFKKKYFTKIGNAYKISDQIKNRVTFQKHDLLKDAYPTDCHLVVCRNVLIYFTEETKDDLFRRFYKCLAPSGTFFIGSTEQIMSYKDIGFQRMNSFFYQK
ncbi:MAG: protein-glutamate O-methyltransferase CheR [Lachnospiraceae bacterium]|nr:protein-glutamate O-methyltransferase CheR [Lachnospiraceae bacterium]